MMVGTTDNDDGNGNGNGNGNGKEQGGIEDSNKAKGSKSPKAFHISISQKGLLDSETAKNSSEGSASVAPGSSTGRFSFGKLASTSLKFQRFAEGRDEMSRSVTATDTNTSTVHVLRQRLSGAIARKMDWDSLKKLGMEWIKNPMNMALFFWIVCVAVSGAILFLVMTGMLNHAIPKKSKRDTWFEVNNQILNALFTLMCLYQHPKRLYHFILLCRWQPNDITRLRKVYCKNGTYKPHEWGHMLVMIFLLNLNCFSQYALCGLNLGYRRSNRPAIGVAICISVAIGAPAIAGVYSIMSPLGKDYDGEGDEESQAVPITSGESARPSHLRSQSLQKRYSFAPRDERTAEGRPQWRGGILDFWEDISLAYLSLFCSFCVFGWNMERLGFGNMFVHITTFILFCTAPFWIFILAAVNIDNEMAREFLVVTGIILCVFGLLYGGFWRIQMRNRFNLPPNNFCFGKPAVTDCALWLCCCWCTLAQEVRTTNYYDVVEDKFYKKETVGANQVSDSALRDESNVGEFSYESNTPSENLASPIRSGRASPSPSRFAKEHFSPESHLSRVAEESSSKGKDETMSPPGPLSIKRDTN